MKEVNELREYFEEIKQNITTLADAKEASKKKWLKIYEKIDTLPWSKYLRSEIWSSCGLCVYKKHIGKTSCEGNCPLYPNCEERTHNLNDVPLNRIMDKIGDNEKPNPQDVLDFIKQIEAIEVVEEPLVKVGDRLKIPEGKEDRTSGDMNGRVVIRIDGDGLYYNNINGNEQRFTISHIKKGNVVVDKSKHNFKVGDILKQTIHANREDPIVKVIKIENDGETIIHQHRDSINTKSSSHYKDFEHTTEKWFDPLAFFDCLKSKYSGLIKPRQEGNYILLNLPSDNREWTFAVWEATMNFVKKYPQAYPEHYKDEGKIVKINIGGIDIKTTL